MTQEVKVITTEAYQTSDGTLFVSLTHALTWEEVLEEKRRKKPELIQLQAASYWLVWSSKAGLQGSHTTWGGAEEEAERLALKYPGVIYSVAEVVLTAQSNNHNQITRTICSPKE